MLEKCTNNMIKRGSTPSREAAGDSPQASSIRPLPPFGGAAFGRVERVIHRSVFISSIGIDFLRYNLRLIPLGGPRLCRRTCNPHGVKIDQKSIRKSIKIRMRFLIDLGSLLGGFGAPCFALFRSKIALGGPKRRNM